MTLLPVISTLASGLTVTGLEATLTHPLASVAVTEYVVVAFGETVIADVVAPVLQMYDEAPEAVNVVLSPIQIILSPSITIVGNGFTFTVKLVVVVQPFVSVAVTVYVVVTAGVTDIVDVISPLLQT